MRLNLVIEFLTQQAEEKLGLARAVFRHHCNHSNVIPYYSEWWRRERLPDYYHCSVCQYIFQPHELLADYESTKREREVTQGGEDAPAGEERRSWNDPPNVPEEDPQVDPQGEVGLSP